MNTTLSFRKIRDSRAAAALAASLLLAAATPATLAGPTTSPTPQASKSESVGVAGGLAVGAAAGGPVGAIIGAAAGGWLGDRLHREKTAHALTRDELASALLRGNGLSMHVMFRTDDARLRADDESLVARFATLAAATPGAVVQVTGFADPRGSARHNAALAAERAAQVVARLVEAGLPLSHVVVSADLPDARPDSPADGGAPAVVETPDLDGFAFQRRVTLKIALPAAGEARVAQQR